ncbi:hypothetical protein [Ascidiimonas sp. W6]|uniref:hypothetical protein n=1 Tax=Ascidiimonas meishanensis TaxID=3128903 RepID=UPI0030EDEA61
MNKIFNCFLALLLVVLTSCNFSEELFLNTDGSGRLSIKFDGSELLKMGNDMGSIEGSGKVMDSVISFKKLLEEKKDSIATLTEEEQEKLKKLEPFNLHMVMNEETGDMKIDMYTDFTEVSELSDVFSAFQNAGAFGNQGMGASQSQQDILSTGEPTEMSYTLNGNTFKRTNKVVDYDLLQKNVDSLGKMELFLGSSTYKLIYHFSTPVKSVSKKGAFYSEDRKTVTIEVPFMDYMRDPEILNLEIELSN